MIDRAIKLIKSAQYQEAEAILRSVLEQAPKNAQALFYLAHARDEQADTEEAIGLMKQAIGVQPANATFYFTLGNLSLDIEDYEQAQNSFLKSVGIDPNNVGSRTGLAFLELHRLNFKEAEKLALIALAIDPDHVLALTLIGSALLEQDRHKEALNHLHRAVKLDPAITDVQFYLGRALLAAGNSDFAARCFENAVKGEPGNARFTDALAQIQLSNGNIREARDNFYRTLELGRINGELLSGLIQVETQLGNADKALGFMSQAAELAPENHELAFQYAEMLMQGGLLDEAGRQLQGLQAAAFRPTEVAVLMATVLSRQGEPEQALSLLGPLKDDEAMEAEIRLKLVLVLQECSDRQTAAEHLEILLAADKPLIEAVLLGAGQMYQAGDKKGLQLLREVLKRDDVSKRDRREAQLLLAHSLDQAGRYAKATLEYQQLLYRDAAVMKLVSEQKLSGSVAEAATLAMNPVATADWARHAPQDGRSQVVFIFAWPGCARGELLLALQQHSLLVFLPNDPVQQSRRRLKLLDSRAADTSGDLDESDIRLGRRRYWKASGVNEHQAIDKTVIDGQWLTAEVLPAIARNFPSTSVLILKRQPEDMAVAWLQSGYKDLESMAAAYQSQMNMLENYRLSLPLKFIDIDHDELRESPAQVLHTTLDALGLESEPAVVNYFKSISPQVPAKSGDGKNYQGELGAVFSQFR